MAQLPRFVISIDYGTTYTGVAWILTTGNTPRLEDINVVTNWPTGELRPKVPSLFTYTENPGEQWGYGIGDNAHVISWNKMKLEKPSRLEAIKTLLKTLEPAEQLAFDPLSASRNQVQPHLAKTPEDILGDYLVRVATVVRQDIRNKRDEAVLKKFPIDLVITHPAIWDARARNATFRAASKAFMKEFEIPNLPPSSPSYVMLATESEACAQYIMNHKYIDNLRKDDCFIVLDAGGGTVDLVSYKVDAVSPNFATTRVTDVSSGRHGATNIDNNFLKIFLPEKLGDQEYEKFLKLGGGHGEHRSGAHTVLRPGEKRMLDKFLTIKEDFKGKPGPGQSPIIGYIDLPEDIGLVDNRSNGILDGRLSITGDDMEEMFRSSVDGTLELIRQQRTLIGEHGLDLKWIFLSGGFSRSRYLARKVGDLAKRYGLRVMQGDDSWTAVVKGATLMGLGVSCEQPPHNSGAPYHIGVVLAEQFASYFHQEHQRYADTFDNVFRAKDHIKWVVAKGDLVTPHEQITKTVKIVQKINPKGKKAGRVRVILSSHDRTSEHLSQLNPLAENHDITRETVNLDYDLGNIPDTVRRNCYKRIIDPQTGKTYDRVEMQLLVAVSVAGDISLDLRAGATEDYWGNTAREGYRLAHHTRAGFLVYAPS
ncbi:hypothetical protein F4824DRAFT_45665 [Ustulina deusta]|nr:hypothetical protein F4824DRAFT_45665 [Ustulina deusta]